MSGEIRKQGDPLLRHVLDSAELDEAPEGSEQAMLAALGLGAAGVTALASTSKLGASAGASAFAKMAPVAAKLLGVLGVVGLGAIAFHSQRSTTDAPPRGEGSPTRTRSSLPPPHERPELPASEPAPAAETPAVVPPHAEAAPVQRAAAPPSPAQERPAAHHEETPTAGASLEVETRLLAAARNALSLGDKTSAREHLRQYQREVQNGVLQREADILWKRAR